MVGYSKPNVGFAFGNCVLEHPPAHIFITAFFSPAVVFPIIADYGIAVYVDCPKDE
jgi:hypothetical protein